MIVVVHPYRMNWFYEAQAHRIVQDLRKQGVAALPLPSNRVARYEGERDCILVISLAEILASAEALGEGDLLRRMIAGFRSRVLVNLDCIHTTWFAKHLVFGARFFTDVFDIGLIAQSDTGDLMGIRYHWIPEALTRDERDSLGPRTGARPVPWAIIAHSSRERSAFVAAAIQSLPSNGFVFSPPLRRFNAESGLDAAALDRVLEKADFYLWGSHHQFRYHEGVRALQSVRCGAAPVKIDPLHADRIDLPWVYPSLDVFRRSDAFADPDASFRVARDRILDNGTLGDRVVEALRNAGVDLPPA